MAENDTKMPPKPLVPSWLAVPLTALVVGGLLLLAVSGVHLLALAGWVTHGDVYLLIVAGVFFLAVVPFRDALVRSAPDPIISAIKNLRKDTVLVNNPVTRSDGKPKDHGDLV